MGYSLTPNSPRRLDALREALAARAAPTCAGARVPTRWPAIDEALGGGLPFAGLHEWWGALDDTRAVCVQLAWEALLFDDRARPGAVRRVAWVGRAAWPAPGDLVRGMRAALVGMFGGALPRTWPDARLHDRSILVDVPPHDAGARLWAIEQAVRCAGVCVVIADGRGLDHAATRRLQLAAADTLLLSLRGPSRDAAARRAAASAAATRWSVERAPDAATVAERAPWLRAVHALAERIPPEPAWSVTLERAKGQDMRLFTACSARAARSFEWEGTDRMPAPEAAAAARRDRRVAELLAERAQRAERRRRADEHEAAPGGQGLVPADAHAPTPLPVAASTHPRGRARDRMTSRGERWARELGARRTG